MEGFSHHAASPHAQWGAERGKHRVETHKSRLGMQCGLVFSCPKLPSAAPTVVVGLGQALGLWCAWHLQSVSVCMCPCVHVCMCAYACAYKSACMHVCMHVKVCMHLCTYLHVSACVYTSAHVCICVHACLCRSFNPFGTSIPKLMCGGPKPPLSPGMLREMAAAACLRAGLGVH